MVTTQAAGQSTEHRMSNSTALLSLVQARTDSPQAAGTVSHREAGTGRGGLLRARAGRKHVGLT